MRINLANPDPSHQVMMEQAGVRLDPTIDAVNIIEQSNGYDPFILVWQRGDPTLCQRGVDRVALFARDANLLAALFEQLHEESVCGQKTDIPSSFRIRAWVFYRGSPEVGNYGDWTLRFKGPMQEIKFQGSHSLVEMVSALRGEGGSSNAPSA